MAILSLQLPGIAMPSLLLLRWSLWFLTGAGALGAWMAALRFGQDRGPSRGLRRLHGLLAIGGLAPLAYAWSEQALPRLGLLAALLLAAAAAGGLGIRWLRRQRWSPSIEVLVFAHLSAAATGYLLLLACAVSAA